ncbi:SDR family oxidoreductase [Chelatococcus sp. SYSU_G07232]|uniref:SDR family oxidoreductase n=1 Tax=Chelatococcus albus TaxID=3047466 RepID=A0ABT7AIT6_9HYPH|nr:SDR family oxidoreductase [Chelatococcus sp. SYSU_G07232]MDJ1159282.1 SDR family oxidoreductase [Chelatococcus sp. SYSU_G07232]
MTGAVREVALITGGARRIGRAIVERLAAEGYAVAIHCRRSRGEAERLMGEIVARGGRAAVVQADLADAAAVAGIMPAARAALGPVTLVVNNASIFEPDEVATLDAALWDRQFAVNLRAPALLARDLANGLPDGAAGAVINILDQRVWKLTPQFLSYTLTKAALHTATKTMAQALAPRIRVNAVAPGPTLSSARQDPADFARQSAAMPLGHGASPEEVAEAVLFLARAASITGQTIAVDGGQHLIWQTPDVVGINE